MLKIVTQKIAIAAADKKAEVSAKNAGNGWAETGVDQTRLKHSTVLINKSYNLA